MTNETEMLWSEFGHRLRGFITRRVDNEADAEDILQDVFLRVDKSAEGVNRADRLTSWLFQISRNAIVDYDRAPERRELPSGIAGEPPLAREDVAASTAAPDRDAAAVRRELAGCPRPLVERLPPRSREPILLVDLAGQTHVEASTRLGLSVSGAESRVQRGRRVLKQLLVDCCPVRLGAGGRIADYEPRDPACAVGAERSDALGWDKEPAPCACAHPARAGGGSGTGGQG